MAKFNKEDYQKVKDMKKMLDPITKGEFMEHFEQIIGFVQKHKDGSLKELKDMKSAYKQLLEASKAELKDMTQKDSTELREAVMGVKTSIDEVVKNFKGELDNKFMEIDDKVGMIKDGKDADEETIVDMVTEKLKDEIKLPEIVNIEEDLPKMGNEIRDALELLQDEDRLDASAIKGLGKALKDLDNRLKGISGSIYQQGGSSSGGKVVKALDLSSKLDGSTRTFAIQTVWRVISIHLTSNPTIMREGVDYTWTPTSITFTSEVSDIALSSGQSLILIVAE